MYTPNLRRTLFALCGMTLLAGCGANQAMVQESGLMQVRVDELEQANRQLQVRLDAYEASLTLIEDQLDAVEVGQRRVAQTNQLNVVRLEPEKTRAAPAYSMPERTTVLRANPASRPAPTYAETGYSDDEYEDIVVSSDKIAKYFGATEGPAPAVDTQERLPFAPMPTPTARPSKPVAPVQAKAEAGPQEDAIEHYKKGLKHYRQEQFQAAIDEFNAFMSGEPPMDYVDNALYWLGECHYGLGRYAEAATYFHRIVKEFPDANKVPDALLKVGLTYQRLDRQDSAREVMYYLIEAYPKTEAARVARERLDADKKAS